MHNEAEEQRRQIDPAGLCAHQVVKYDPIDHGNGRYSERWTCRDCRLRFVPEPTAKAMLDALMPERATLRDQFAMAAMIADAVSSGMVAAAYIAQGKTFEGEVDSPVEGAREYYETADAMMKAREKPCE